MLKNKFHLVTLHENILVCQLTFQQTLVCSTKKLSHKIGFEVEMEPTIPAWRLDMVLGNKELVVWGNLPI